jgi:NADH-quinone oxidoreductase subunit C
MSQEESRTGDARLDALVDALGRHFDELGCEVLIGRREVTLVVPVDPMLEVAGVLRDHEDFRFSQLMDLSGVDYAAYGCSEWDTESVSTTGFGRGVDRELEIGKDDPRRFAVAYQLLSLAYNRRLRMRVYAGGGQPMVDSVIGVWSSADWYEREAFDLYGILFRGHPDLRRILTDYGFIGYPFRKDFPISGQVEMRYDPEEGRVVYQPVSIDPRTLVPRVIRSDSRYEGGPQTDGPNA